MVLERHLFYDIFFLGNWVVTNSMTIKTLPVKGKKKKKIKINGRVFLTFHFQLYVIVKQNIGKWMAKLLY